jgi:hypothetical protein
MTSVPEKTLFGGQAAELKAQAQAMAHTQQTLSARMTALERRSVESQAVALERSAKQRVAINKP